MIPLCQLGIQKLHIHWKYPSGSGFIHTRSDTSKPLRHRQRNDRPSIRRCLPWRHHRVTWITWSPLWRFPHSPNSVILVLFAILRAPHDAAYWDWGRLPSLQLTIFQHWSRSWHGAGPVMNQWCTNGVLWIIVIYHMTNDSKLTVENDLTGIIHVYQRVVRKVLSYTPWTS